MQDKQFDFDTYTQWDINKIHERQEVELSMVSLDHDHNPFTVMVSAIKEKAENELRLLKELKEEERTQL